MFDENSPQVQEETEKNAPQQPEELFESAHVDNPYPEEQITIPDQTINKQQFSAKRIGIIAVGVIILLFLLIELIGPSVIPNYPFYLTKGKTNKTQETFQPTPLPVDYKQVDIAAISSTTSAQAVHLSQLITSKTLDPKALNFSEYKEDKLSLNPNVPDYDLGADDLPNTKAIEAATQPLSSVQKEALSNPGFFTVPAKNLIADGNKLIDFRHQGLVDEFLLHYDLIGGSTKDWERKPENTVFITSDFLLHTFHVFVDRTFQYIEETKFHPMLKALSDALFNQALIETQNTTDAKLKASFTRLASFYLVPKVLLETSQNPYKREDFGIAPDELSQVEKTDETIDKAENILAQLEHYKNIVTPEIYDITKAELQLISEAKDLKASPLFGQLRPEQPDDYTQYKPRSHYTKNSVLRSYWKAMIWYGRNGFLTKSDDLTLDAIVQSLLLQNIEIKFPKGTLPLLATWANIYVPTTFFVGKSDDLTILDYQPLIAKIYGSTTTFASLTDTVKFNQFKEEVKKLAGPQIQSSVVMVGSKTTKEGTLDDTKSFRFMGQRFTPDAFIFSSLTQGDEAPDPETGQKLPPVPTALMPMSIFGSTQADKHLNTWILTQAPNSDKVIANKKRKLTETFNTYSEKEWTQNIYWSWLYTLKPLFLTFSSGYPKFMQSESWSDKSLGSALGSWTELKHDTLLYAKQSYAEMGGGGEHPEPPPVPKGYVEPNLVFLNRIIALATLLRDGLESNNIMPDEQKGKIDRLIDRYSFFRDVAIKELKNDVISDADFEKLRKPIFDLNYALTPADYSLQYMKAGETRAGLIADVHTAMTQAKQEILYEAVGIPQIIYVTVKDSNGARLTRGVTYSYYEFSRPFGERLSDSDWQANLYESKNTFPKPSQPDWLQSLQK